MESVCRPRRRGSLFSKCLAVCLVLEYKARKDGKEHLIFSSMMKSLSKPSVCLCVYMYLMILFSSVQTQLGQPEALKAKNTGDKTGDYTHGCL